MIRRPAPTRGTVRGAGTDIPPTPKAGDLLGPRPGFIETSRVLAPLSLDPACGGRRAPAFEGRKPVGTYPTLARP